MKKAVQLLFLMIMINIFSQDISGPRPTIQMYNESTNEFVNFDSNLELGCGIESIQIKASWTDIGSPDSYRIEAIPFNPKPYLQTTGSTVSEPVVGFKLQTLSDDTWSSIIPLASNGSDLNFCFFGNARNEFVITDNGIVSFDTSYANGYSDWTLQTMGKIYPNANCANDPDENKDTILLAHDTNPLDSDAQFDTYSFWDILGNIGERYFIMGTHNMPMYSCGSDYGSATHQMVFYETTNIIEFHIQDKPLCDTWIDGYMAMGIQNADRTIGFAAPGRDNLDQYQILKSTVDTDGDLIPDMPAAFNPDTTNYPIHNPEGWRLIPDGVNGTAPVFGWYLNWDNITSTGTFVSNDPILSVSQENVPVVGNVTYTAVVTYVEYCSGNTYYATSDVLVNNTGTLQMHLQEQNSSDDTIEFIEIEEINLCTVTDYNLTTIIQNAEVDATSIIEWTIESSGNPATVVQTNNITGNGNVNYLISSGSLTDGVTYTFTSTITSGDCSMSDVILIHALDNIPAPINECNLPIEICNSETITLADLPVSNTVGFTSIYWFSTMDQQIGSELNNTTVVVEGQAYYVFQDNSACATGISVIIEFSNINTTAPTGEIDQYFFNENMPTFTDIIIFNTDGFTGVYWFADASQITPINPTEPLIEGTYYVFQGIGDCYVPLAVNIHLIDLNGDEDNDTIVNGDEDLNNDGNPVNEDTDGDNIPDFLDNDDDGDSVPTSTEAVITTLNKNALDFLDTDGDLIPNYLDNDDDGDGVLTINEDYDGDGNPANDDTNHDSIPDYLQQSVALSVFNTDINLFSIHPNPVKDILNIQFEHNNSKTSIVIYNALGSLVYKNNYFNKENINIDVSELNVGVYFIKSQIDNKTNTKKFIKL